jgi:hypothetical protein
MERLETQIFQSFWSNKTKGPKQDGQNLGAIKPKGLNKMAKIWEQ